MGWGESNLIKNVDALIRAGASSEAIAILKALPNHEIPREYKWEVAELWRRLQKPFETLKILNSAIINQREGIEKASIEEITTFCGGLIKIGATNEAQSLLRELKPNGRVYFMVAAAYVAEWDYAKASTFFKKYIKTLEPNSYQHQIGNLNLAACYVATGQIEHAQNLLNQLLQVTEKNQNDLIQGNCLELLAQLWVTHLNNYKKADYYLNKAETLFSGKNNFYDQYIHKWKLISQIKHFGPTEQLMIKLNKLKEKSNRLGDYETKRELDLHLAITKQSNSLIDKVLFGTRFPAYKKKIKALAPASYSPSTSYIWSANTGKETNIISEVGVSKPGSIVQKLFSILTTDFYRPIPTGTLFSQLYPNEYFDPFNSPARLNRNVQRLKTELNNKSASINFQCSIKSGFLMSPLATQAIQVGLCRETSDRLDFQIKLLKASFKGQWFDCGQACNFLGAAERTGQRILNYGLGNKHLIKEGEGKSTRYSFRPHRWVSR